MRRLRKGQAGPAELDAPIGVDAPDAALAAEPPLIETAEEPDQHVETVPEPAPASEIAPTPAEADADIAEPLSVQDHLRLGDVAAARHAVQEAEGDIWGPLVAALAEGEAVLRTLGLASDDDPEGRLRGVMLAPNEGAREVLLVFGGDDGNFAVPEGVVRNRRAHLLFLRDPGYSLSLLGVARLGETYDACLMALTRLVRTLEARDVFCLGGGAACYSALRYGLDMGAAGVLALGTLTRLERGTAAPGVRPARQAGRLFRLADELGPDLELACQKASPRPGLVLCRPDRDAMAGLAALSGTKVTEAPAEAADDVLGWADRGGQLRGLVRELLRCRAAR